MTASAAAARSRTRNYAVALAVVASLLVALSIFLYDQTQTARSRELAALALATDHQDRGLLLAGAAHAVKPTVEAKAALMSLLRRLRHVERFLHGYPAGVRSVDYHPESGRVAAAGEGGTIAVWETSRPERPRWCRERTLHGHAAAGNRIHSLVFTPDGASVVSAFEYGGVGIWDFAAGQYRRINGWPPPSPGTQKVSVDLYGPDPELPKVQGERPVTALAIDKSRNFLVASDHVGRLFGVDIDEARVKWMRRAGLFGFASLDVVPRLGLVIASDDDGTLHAFNIDGQPIDAFGEKVHAARLILFQELLHGFLTLDRQGNLVHWNHDGDKFLVAAQYRLPIQPFAAAIDVIHERLLLSTLQGGIRTFSLEGDEGESFVGHRLAAMSITCDQQGERCVSGGVSGEVVIWNVADSHSLIDHKLKIDDFIIDLHNQGPNVDVITQSTSSIRWQPLFNDGPAIESPTNRDYIGIAFRDGDSSYATANAEDGVLLFDTGSVEPERYQFGGHDPMRLSTMGISKQFVAVSDNRPALWVWRLDRPETPLFYAELPEQLSKLHFDPDDRFLFGGGMEGTLMRWSLTTPLLEERRVHGANGPIFAMTFGESGEYIITGSGAADRNIRIWDSDDLKLVRQLPEVHSGSISVLARLHQLDPKFVEYKIYFAHK